MISTLPEDAVVKKKSLGSRLHIHRSRPTETPSYQDSIYTVDAGKSF